MVDPDWNPGSLDLKSDELPAELTGLLNQLLILAILQVASVGHDMEKEIFGACVTVSSVYVREPVEVEYESLSRD